MLGVGGGTVFAQPYSAHPTALNHCFRPTSPYDANANLGKVKCPSCGVWGRRGMRCYLCASLVPGPPPCVAARALESTRHRASRSRSPSISVCGNPDGPLGATVVLPPTHGGFAAESGLPTTRQSHDAWTGEVARWGPYQAHSVVVDSLRHASATALQQRDWNVPGPANVMPAMCHADPHARRSASRSPSITTRSASIYVSFGSRARSPSLTSAAARAAMRSYRSAHQETSRPPSTKVRCQYCGVWSTPGQVCLLCRSTVTSRRAASPSQ